MTHDGEHERMLERILAGELGETATEAARVLAGCPACRDELARLRALERKLADEAERQRADFELARGTASADEERQVRLSLEKALAAPTPRRRLRRLPVAWLAAAAVLLAFLGWMNFGPERREGPAEQKEVLLGGNLELRFDPASMRVDWEGTSSDTFEVEIRSVRDGRGDGLLFRRTVYEPTWSPTREEQASLPEQVFVEVTSEDSSKNGWRILSLTSSSEH